MARHRHAAPAPSAPAPSAPARPPAGPAARRAALACGVDLGRIAGSGRRGRVTVEDVRRAAARPAGRAPVTACADVTGLVGRLPALAAASGQDAAPLTPLLIKAAAAALRATPGLAPLSIAKGAERWTLADGGTVAGLGMSALTQAAAAARFTPPAGASARPGAALRMDGPVTGAAYRDGAVRARAHLRLTLEGSDDVTSAPFVRTLVQLLETPVLLLAS